MLIDKVAWIHIMDKRLLCARSRGINIFYIPGGEREDAETDEEVLIREIREELNVDIISETIAFYDVFQAQAHNRPIGTVVRMLCYFSQYKGELQAHSEIEEIQWLEYKDRKLTSEVDQIIFDHLKIDGFL